MAKGIVSGVAGLAVMLLAVRRRAVRAARHDEHALRVRHDSGVRCGGRGGGGRLGLRLRGGFPQLGVAHHARRHVARFADGFYGASGNAVGPRGDLYQSSFFGTGGTSTWSASAPQPSPVSRPTAR